MHADEPPTSQPPMPQIPTPTLILQAAAYLLEFAADLADEGEVRTPNDLLGVLHEDTEGAAEEVGMYFDLGVGYWIESSARTALAHALRLGGEAAADPDDALIEAGFARRTAAPGPIAREAAALAHRNTHR